jgi:hypothetical protein
LEFSAVGFFYGKELYEALSIPVGLIQSAWGGTPVEAWIRKEDFDKGLAERYSTLENTYQLDSSYYYQALSNYKKGSIVNKPDMPESVNYNLRKHKKLSVLYNILKIDKNQIQMTPRENILKTLRREGFETTLFRLNKCGEKGGIVIGPTHMVEPEVPWENLTAIIEGTKSFEKNR